MRESTRRARRKQAQAACWVEIVALAEAGVAKAQIARRCDCCRQTVYNVLARAAQLPQHQAPVPQRPGPARGSGSRLSSQLRQLLIRWRWRNGSRGAAYCRAALGLSIAASTIQRVWQAAGLIIQRQRAERPRTRWVPPRPQAPGHLQVDVKYLPGGRFEYTAIDLYSRYVWAQVATRLDSATAADFLRAVLACAPFSTHTVQTDNGSEFALDFSALLRAQGITQRRNAPRCAWQNGTVERFHRTVAQECYLELHGELEHYSTTKLDRRLQDWLGFYNSRRLHKSLGYRTPENALLSSSHKVSIYL